MTKDTLAATDWTNIYDAMGSINAWADRTFPRRSLDATLSKLVLEEIPELLTHKKNLGVEGIGEELADCFILLLDLAMIWGVDLPAALRSKMLKNANRTWDYDPDTKFYTHRKDSDGTEGSNTTDTHLQRPEVDNNSGSEATDCRGAPVPSMGVSPLFVRLSDGWHTPQFLRKGRGWTLGPCTRCGRDLDWGHSVECQISNRTIITRLAEEAKGKGAG